MNGLPRRVANPLIGLVLAFQLLMPLSYYLGQREYDERFSWRMFSTRRMARCSVRVWDIHGAQQTPVDLRATLQVAWVNMLKRYRPAVVEHFLEQRCATQPAPDAARYLRVCRDTDGSRLPPVDLRLSCQSGQLQAEGSSQ